MTERGLSVASGSDLFKPLVDGVQSVTVEVTGLNNVLTKLGGAGSGADDGFVGRLQSLQEQFQTEREVVDAWYEESQAILADRRAMELLGEQEHKSMLLQVEDLYQQQLAAIKQKGNQWSLQSVLEGSAQILGAMGSFGQKFLKAQAIVSAGAAFMSTMQGAAKELEKGTFGFATAAAVIAKGLGFVAAIKGASSGGGSGGGASGGGAASASREPTTAPAQQQRIIRFDVRSDGPYSSMFAEMLRENVGAIADAIIDEQRLGGTTILVGRS
jgi:hypothetical protein